MADSIIGNPIEGSTRRRNTRSSTAIDSAPPPAHGPFDRDLDQDFDPDFDPAFDPFFDEHWQPLIRLARLLSVPGASAEEIAQTALTDLYAHRHRNRFDMVTSLEDRVAYLAFQAEPHQQSEPSDREFATNSAFDSLKLLHPHQRTAYVLTALEGWPTARVATALKQEAPAVETLVANAIQLLTDTDDRFRHDRRAFEEHLGIAGANSHSNPTVAQRHALRKRAELIETRLRRKTQRNALVAAFLAFLMVIIAIRSVSRQATQTAAITTLRGIRPPIYESVANQPMRLMPTWLPGPGSEAPVVPIKFAGPPPAENESGGYLGVWGNGLKYVSISVTPKIKEFPIGMFRQPDRSDSIEQAEALGPTEDFWEGTEPSPFPVTLSWISQNLVIEVTAPPSTPWNEVVVIAKSMAIDTKTVTFSVDKPPFEAEQIFLGRASEVEPSQSWWYRLPETRAGPGVNLTIERLTQQGRAVRMARINATPSIVSVRGKEGFSFSQPSYSYSVRADGEVGKVQLTSDRDVSVSVADGDWLLTANGQNKPIDELVRILNGLKQVDVLEWNDLLASADLPAGETLASMRTPKRVVSVGEINQTKWNIAVAQLVTRAGCLSVRLDVGGSISGACVPIENRATVGPLAPILFHPKAQSNDKPQSIAVVFTDETVESVLGPIGNVPVDKVVVKSGGIYSNFGVAVVALPDNFTKVTLQQLRRSPDGRLEQIQGPTIANSPDTK